MGKWSEAARDLPRVERLEPSYQAKVNEAKSGIENRTPGKLAALYKEKRKRKDEAESRVEAINVEIAAIEQLGWEALEDADLTSVKLEGGGSFGVTDDISVAVEDRAAFIAWLKENDLDSLLTVYSATAASIVKERIEAHEDIPPGIRVGSFKKTVFRRR